MQSRDEATLRRRLADDFIMVHSNGAAIDTRDRFIAFLKSGGGSTPRSQVTRYDTVIRPISSGVVLITETVNLREGDPLAVVHQHVGMAKGIRRLAGCIRSQGGNC
jgi:hypothetical protein